jgi:hypothetical protein
MNTNSENSKSSSFAIHQFGDILIYQANGDVLLSNKTIPHGYVNATQICKANNKKLNDWTRLKRSNDYIEALSTDTGIPVSALLVEIIGGGNGKGATFQGTFVHPDIAISIASWISPKFEIWANRTIRAVINGDFQALTPEASKAQAQLQSVWDELRIYTKETFWFVTDSIKNYYIENQRIEKYPGQNYSEYFDCLNIGLFGKKAKQISEELGITKGTLNRDNFGKDSLKKIEMIQRISESQIKLSLNPLDACKKALEIMNYEIGDFKE